MVYNKEFAFAHIPRTGGDALHKFFELFKSELDLTVDPIPGANLTEEHKKHDSFHIRKVADRPQLLLGIRRLPTWFFSFQTGLWMDGPFPDFKPLPKPNKSDLFDVKSLYGKKHLKEFTGPLANIGDRYLEYYTDLLKLPIYKWIRMEFLLHDFLGFIGEKAEIKFSHIRALAKVETKSPREYEKGVLEEWSFSQISKAYENNPKWAELERKIYGNLVID